MIAVDRHGWHADDSYYFGWPEDTPRPRLHLVVAGSEEGRAWCRTLCRILIPASTLRRQSAWTNICVKCLEKVPLPS